MRETDFDFEAKIKRREGFKANALRFLKYLSSRKMECWGFFAAGFLIATIF